MQKPKEEPENKRLIYILTRLLIGHRYGCSRSGLLIVHMRKLQGAHAHKNTPNTLPTWKYIRNGMYCTCVCVCPIEKDRERERERERERKKEREREREKIEREKERAIEKEIERERSIDR